MTVITTMTESAALKSHAGRKPQPGRCLTQQQRREGSSHWEGGTAAGCPQPRSCGLSQARPGRCPGGWARPGQEGAGPSVHGSGPEPGMASSRWGASCLRVRGVAFSGRRARTPRLPSVAAETTAPGAPGRGGPTWPQDPAAGVGSTLRPLAVASCVLPYRPLPSGSTCSFPPFYANRGSRCTAWWSLRSPPMAEGQGRGLGAGGRGQQPGEKQMERPSRRQRPQPLRAAHRPRSPGTCWPPAWCPPASLSSPPSSLPCRGPPDSVFPPGGHCHCPAPRPADSGPRLSSVQGTTSGVQTAALSGSASTGLGAARVETPDKFPATPPAVPRRVIGSQLQPGRGG